jgi:hypothetical protein
MEHHNYKIAQPIITRLLETLGDKWENTSYCQDSLASIGFETLEGDLINIYVPNALECKPMQEQYSVFHLNVCGEYFPEYNTIEEVIEAFKDGVLEFYETIQAIERKEA